MKIREKSVMSIFRRETLKLTAEERKDLETALQVAQFGTDVSPRAKALREKFQGFAIPTAIYTQSLAVSFVAFICGEIPKDHSDIQLIEKNVRALGGDSQSYSVIMEIIRAELQLDKKPRRNKKRDHYIKSLGI